MKDNQQAKRVGVEGPKFWIVDIMCLGPLLHLFKQS